METFDRSDFLKKISSISHHNNLSSLTTTINYEDNQVIILNYAYVSAFALAYLITYYDITSHNYLTKNNLQDLRFKKKLIRKNIINLPNEYLLFLLKDTLNVFNKNIYTYKDLNKKNVNDISRILEYSIKLLI
jgi:hypothetical protein